MNPERKLEKVPERPVRSQTPPLSVSIRSGSTALPLLPLTHVLMSAQGACHHRPELAGTRGAKSCRDWSEHRELAGRQLLRKRGAIEMVHEHLHECGAVQIRELGNFADHPDVAKSLDGFAVLPILIADQHHAMHWQFRCVQRS